MGEVEMIFLKRMVSLLLVAVFFCGAWAVAQPAVKVAELLRKADQHDDNKQYEQSMEVLQQAEELDPDNPQVLWRLARNYFQFADQQPQNMAVQKENLYPGFEYAKRCVELAPEVAGGHQYYAILIGRIGEIEGTKQKIKNSYAVKEHTLKAISLDPDNDSNYHVMGRWHFALADLSWIERQVASVIYATPPKASFEEAAQFFKKAHQLNSDDIRHLLWLGKTYIELDREAQARQYLDKALQCEITSDSDKVMHQEAQELLADL